jgi:hypothetical protein
MQISRSKIEQPVAALETVADHVLQQNMAGAIARKLRVIAHPQTIQPALLPIVVGKGHGAVADVEQIHIDRPGCRGRLVGIAQKLPDLRMAQRGSIGRGRLPTASRHGHARIVKVPARIRLLRRR